MTCYGRWFINFSYPSGDRKKRQRRWECTGSRKLSTRARTAWKKLLGKRPTPTAKKASAPQVRPVFYSLGGRAHYNVPSGRSAFIHGFVVAGAYFRAYELRGRAGCRQQNGEAAMSPLTGEVEDAGPRGRRHRPQNHWICRFCIDVCRPTVHRPCRGCRSPPGQSQAPISVPETGGLARAADE